MTEAEAYAKLATLTHLSAQEWRDLLQCSAAQIALTIQTYADQAWAQSGDILSEVLAVFAVLMTVAADVTGIATAISAVEALKAAA